MKYEVLELDVMHDGVQYYVNESFHTNQFLQIEEKTSDLEIIKQIQALGFYFKENENLLLISGDLESGFYIDDVIDDELKPLFFLQPVVEEELEVTNRELMALLFFHLYQNNLFKDIAYKPISAQGMVDIIDSLYKKTSLKEKNPFFDSKDLISLVNKGWLITEDDLISYIEPEAHKLLLERKFILE